MCYGFVNAKEAKETYKYMNTKERLYKTIVAIWFNKVCKEKQLAPNYVSNQNKWAKTHNARKQ